MQINRSDIFNKPSFKGVKAPAFRDFRVIADVVNDKLDGSLASELADKVRKYAPKLVDGEGFVEAPYMLRSFGDALVKPFVEVASLTTKGMHRLFPNNELINGWNTSRLKYIENKQDKLYERAARGIYQWGEGFVKKGDGTQAVDELGKVTKGGRKKIEDGFYEAFAKNLAFDNPDYNGVLERTGTRFVSGMIPAVFLGYDFYNKALRDGATGEEAEKDASKKRGQEIFAGIGETATQYGVLSGFPNFVNNSTMAAPILSTSIGIFFHITSRLSKGMPLTRIKLDDTPVFSAAQSDKPSFGIQEFINYAKKPAHPSFGYGAATINLQEPEKENGRILSPKNIALLCLASMASGLALKLGVPKLAKTKLGVTFGETFKPFADKLSNKFKAATLEKLWVSEENLKPFYEKLKKTGNKKMIDHYKDVVNQVLTTSTDENLVRTVKKTGAGGVVKEVREVCLGEVQKIFKPLGVEITRKNLYTIPLAPFKLIKEIVSFPYKALEKLLEVVAEKVLKNTEKNPEKANKYVLGFFENFKKPAKNADPLNGLMHFYRDFTKCAKKFDSKDEQEFLDFYKEHLTKNALKTLDKEGNSKIDNAKIGKVTQLLGSFASIYFAMLDDYNRTAKRTQDKEQAGQDARERGVNKFFRIVSQIVLIDIFNGVFKIPYAQSLLGAFGVTAACTVATENVSRALSGMPSKKMDSKEELTSYKENQKNGTFGWYFKLIEKLSK